VQNLSVFQFKIFCVAWTAQDFPQKELVGVDFGNGP